MILSWRERNVQVGTLRLLSMVHLILELKFLKLMEVKPACTLPPCVLGGFLLSIHSSGPQNNITELADEKNGCSVLRLQVTCPEGVPCRRKLKNQLDLSHRLSILLANLLWVIQKYWGGIGNGKVQKSLLTSYHINSVRMKTETNKQKL